MGLNHPRDLDDLAPVAAVPAPGAADSAIGAHALGRPRNDSC